MLYLSIKALHIIAMVCWFAGLFYLPRLFVYHTTVQNNKEEYNRFCTMERKLYKGIMLPSMVITIIFGGLLIYLNSYLLSEGWIHAKLTLVLFLIGYHHICGAYVKKFAQNINSKSEKFYRWFNEAPVIFLILIVFLAILKPF